MGRKVVLYRDVNTTVNFYFEQMTPEYKFWQKVEKSRMMEIFLHCLRCPNLSAYSEKEILKWLEVECKMIFVDKKDIDKMKM